MRVEIDSRYYSRDAEVATAEYDAYQVYSSPADSFNYSVGALG